MGVSPVTGKPLCASELRDDPSMGRMIARWRREPWVRVLLGGDSNEPSDESQEMQTLRDENTRLQLAGIRDSERIERLTDQIRVLTRAAAEVVVAAKSCCPTAVVSVG